MRSRPGGALATGEVEQGQRGLEDSKRTHGLGGEHLQAVLGVVLERVLALPVNKQQPHGERGSVMGGQVE